MTGEVVQLQNVAPDGVVQPDAIATRITERYVEWETLRRPWRVEKEEIRRYVYATDTTTTSNAKLPWKNKTTTPKICNIRDNLKANYSMTTFPKRKSMDWIANDKNSASVIKRNSIVNYMGWCIDQQAFRQEMDKLYDDYIDYGNAFGTVEWTDQRVILPNKLQVGFVGPSIHRINPLNIVFNPTAEDFYSSPKIVRSIISLGELKKLLSRMSTDENREEYEKLYEYLKTLRFHARTFQGENWDVFDRMFATEGFTSFRAYLLQDFVEVLTFYGDWYDDFNDTFQENRVITVVDRHKLIGNKPNPAYFGYPPIFQCSWRKRQDNLWGMGPLDNLIGMQYRLDHIENMKADIADLCTYPVQKIKGFVEDYVWQPGEKIFIGDEGDVNLVVPDVNWMQLNTEKQVYENDMEVFAGAPKEAMGFRSPGEKTAFEVQRLENAASRIFMAKIKQFEEQMIEPLLNAMLELARRNLVQATTIPVFDDDFNLTTFQTLTPEDITGIGRIKPVAARHFAEKAQLIQNLTNLMGSPAWQTISIHFSAKELAKLFTDGLDLRDVDGLNIPFIGLAEQAEAQQKVQVLQEQLHKQIGTATGMHGDFDIDHPQPQQKATPFDLKREPPASAQPGGMLATV